MPGIVVAVGKHVGRSLDGLLSMWDEARRDWRVSGDARERPVCELKTLVTPDHTR